MTTITIVLSLCTIAAIVVGLGNGFGANDRSGLGLGLIGIALVLSSWRFGLYPNVTATDNGLTVRNPFGTSHVPWNDVVSVSPGYSGLVIVRTNGEAVTVSAVQEANIADWLGRETRSKRIAAEFMQLAARTEGDVT